MLVSQFVKNVLLVLFFLSFLAGCASQPMYHWGSYEDQLYNTYNNPGKTPPEQQIIALEADYQKARSSDQPVPPGFHAYLGYLYFQVGKMDQAYQEFNTEKGLYPESSVFMDRLLKQIKGK